MVIRGNRSATMRHTAMTVSATPTEPTISKVVPLCGAAPDSQASRHDRGPVSPSTHPGGGAPRPPPLRAQPARAVPADGQAHAGHGEPDPHRRGAQVAP